MDIRIPWGLLAIAISLISFYYFSQKAKLRKKYRKEKLKEKRDAYYNALNKNK